MEQEDKELLLKDLCARLPYKTLCTDLRHGDSIITSIDLEDSLIFCFDFNEWREIEQCKPYLRPMSSMTDEEKIEWDAEYAYNSKTFCYEEYLFRMIGWLNEHHFDYNGLIEKGLALEAPEGMYDN